MLTLEQQQVAEARPAHLVVVAGPGTGKTQTVAARVEYLLAQGAAPETILVFTFTRKAARELRERIGAAGRYTRIGTFHAVLYSTLANRPCVISQAAADLLLDRCAVLTGRAKQTKSGVKYLKSSRARVRDELDAQRMQPASDNDLVQQYESQLRHDNAIDYIGIIAYGVREISRGLFREVRHVIVDEAQDTDRWQWRVIHQLAEFANIMAVGDPNQCIYEWRGVNLQDFLSVPWQPFALTQSFRNPTGVTEAANRLAKINGYGLTDLKSRQYISDVRVWDSTVVETVQLLQNSLFEDESIAVLCRYNEQVEQYAKALDYAGINVNVANNQTSQNLGLLLTYLASPGSKILKDACAQQFAAYLSLMPHPLLRHICLSSLLECQAYCEDWLAGLAAAPSPESVLNALPIHSDFTAEADGLREEFRGFTLSEAVDELVMGEGIQRDESGVSIMTIHQAKGLEWGAVIVADCNLGLFPRNLRQLNEERRLFYVALTRAKEACVVLCRKGMPVSPFIQEAGIGVEHERRVASEITEFHGSATAP